MNRLIPLIFDTRYISTIGVLSYFALTGDSSGLFCAIELALDLAEDHIVYRPA